MSPDAVSPYSDRPIRPLPKRRLRERLSPDVADSIKYPPAPQTTTPLFYHPYTLREETANLEVVEATHPSERERADEIERNYISRRNGDELDSEEDEAAYRSRVYSRHAADTAGRSYRYIQNPDSKHPNPHPPTSATSSVDGYDSFENTNNKKKRKIPTPGDSILNGVHHSSELIGMGINGSDDTADDASHGVISYHAVGSIAGAGLSGPGRGRYGRVRNGRSPLRTLSDSSGNWGNGRTPKQRQAQWPASAESPGIISRSIASANAQKSPITPAHGQENISLLQQSASKKHSPSTQFTFTCDSQVPGTVPWPGPSTVNSMHQSLAATRMATHSTQTNNSMGGGVSAQNAPSHARQVAQASQHAPNTQKPGAAPSLKKSRRRPGKEYLLAAKQRRQQQEFKNYHHPPAVEDIWICEFCEYERIFGSPPKALIRQYEIKDRHARKQEAERRRLLEKAKMKGRKGKKGSKATPKSNSAAHDGQPQHQSTHQTTAMDQSHSQETQSEEYYEDEYDGDYPQDDAPPPSPDILPGAHSSEARPLGNHVTTQGGGGSGGRVAT